MPVPTAATVARRTACPVCLDRLESAEDHTDGQDCDQDESQGEAALLRDNAAVGAEKLDQ